MDAQQLSSLLAPYMLWASEGSEEASGLDWQVRINDLVAVMIVNYPLLFEAEEEAHYSAKPEVRKCVRFLRKVPDLSCSAMRVEFLIPLQVTGHLKSIGSVELVWGGDKWHIWSGDSSSTIRVWEADNLRFLKHLETGQVTNSLSVNTSCNNTASFQVDSPSSFIGAHICHSSSRHACVDRRREVPPDPRHARGLGQGNPWFCVLDLLSWYLEPCNSLRLATSHTHAPLENLQQVWVGGDAKLTVWNANTLDTKREVNVNAFVLSMTHLGDQLWMACNDKIIRIFNTQASTPLRRRILWNRA